jgi:beta-lactamase class A
MKSLLFPIMALCSSLCTASPLEQQVLSIEQQISGRIGIAFIDTLDSRVWRYRGDERFPMMSTFKLLACAKLLHDADMGSMNLERGTIIREQQLVEWSPITKKRVGQSITFREACAATMLTSDNTAANIVLTGIGGPKELTTFVRKLGDSYTRLDRIEPDLNQAIIGDVRDTTTPMAMAHTVQTLLFGDILTKLDTKQLMHWMQQNTISASLLRSVLPHGWSIADRTGAGENGSRGITAVLWQSERKPIIIVIYLTETDLPLRDHNQIVATLGRLLFSELAIKAPSN